MGTSRVAHDPSARGDAALPFAGFREEEER